MTHVRLNTAMGGSVDENRNFHFEEGDIVEWHDEKDAQRMADKGSATILSTLEVSQLTAAGKRIKRHPHLRATARK